MATRNFFVPETKGRTLEQMDHVFKDNSSEEEKAKRRVMCSIDIFMATQIDSCKFPMVILILGTNKFGLNHTSLVIEAELIRAQYENDHREFA
jgi:hypothetical protein